MDGTAVIRLRRPIDPDDDKDECFPESSNDEFLVKKHNNSYRNNHDNNTILTAKAYTSNTRATSFNNVKLVKDTDINQRRKAVKCLDPPGCCAIEGGSSTGSSSDNRDDPVIVEVIHDDRDQKHQIQDEQKDYIKNVRPSFRNLKIDHDKSHMSRRRHDNTANTSRSVIHTGSSSLLPPVLEPVSSKSFSTISGATTISDATSMVSAPSFARSVHFTNVEIREHSYTLDYGGGNVNPVTGLVSPPLTLSWDAQSISVSNIEDYEAQREPHRRKLKENLIKSEEEKIRILKNAGFQSEELKIIAEDSSVVRTRMSDEERSISIAQNANELYEDFKNSFIQEQQDPRKHKRGIFGRCFGRKKI